jgi:transposase InsO family protein
METVEKVLRLYREVYSDFNVSHFVDKLHEEHEIDLSYSWVKKALQEAGLVARKRKRGRHFKQRSRRPLPGMLLHVDGSQHEWLPEKGHQHLIVIFDDATSEVYYAQLVDQESTATVMTALKETVENQGIFCALYADRASHIVYTEKAGERPSSKHRTQIGRALEQLGIELIAANSPQARGRCERLFGTWQGRLPQELRLHNIDSVTEANRFLREYWIDFHNRRFAVEPSQEGTAFVSADGADLRKIFSRQEHRVVQNDNTVHYQRRILQIEKQRFRYSMARCKVLVCEHLDGLISLYYGPHLLGVYDQGGELLEEAA